MLVRSPCSFAAQKRYHCAEACTGGVRCCRPSSLSLSSEQAQMFVQDAFLLPCVLKVTVALESRCKQHARHASKCLSINERVLSMCNYDAGVSWFCAKFE
eukprot:scaffold27534_cov20-Tisochrysis_lutea.AAC.2